MAATTKCSMTDVAAHATTRRCFVASFRSPRHAVHRSVGPQALSGRTSIAVATSRRQVKVFAVQAGTRLLKKAAQIGSGPVFVAGAEGQTSVRIIKALTQAGYKVVAGVVDGEAATAALKFAQKFELVDRAAAGNVKVAEVDFANAEELAAAIPRRGKVVIVEGDAIDKRRRVDAKFIASVVAAAGEAEAGQVVLVSQAGAGGGTSFFGFEFGGGNKSAPSARPTRAESLVQDSGLNHLIVRAAGLDKTDDGWGANRVVEVGALGSFPGSAYASKLQVAEVVAELMQQAKGNYAIEVAGVEGGEDIAVGSAVATLLNEIDVKDTEQRGQALERARAAAPSIDLDDGVEPDDEEEQQQDGTQPFSFFGIGTRKIKAAIASRDEAKQQQKQQQQQKPPQRGGAPSGTKVVGKRAPPPPPPKQQQRRGRQQEAEEEEAPSKRRGGFFAPRGKQQEQNEEEEPAPVRGIFGGARKPKAAAEEAKVAKAVAEKTRGVAFFGGKKQQAKDDDDDDEEQSAPKKRGLFGLKPRKVVVEEDELYVD